MLTTVHTFIRDNRGAYPRRLFLITSMITSLHRSSSRLLLSSQMAALPSFIELMASLGLDGEPKPSPSCISTTRSRSASCSSVSSIASSNQGCTPTSPSFDASSESFSRDLDVDRRHGSGRLRTVRYSPYISASSTSPRLSSSPSRHRPLSLQFSKNTRELHASTPISSYVRRKTPQNSPTAATFSHRIHAERPETITLPSLLSAPTLH
ncbi:hypothetical protein PAXRUDRAFT_655398 [Paxillus rubicundulus Ve08.2h10]|uniref:Uncharacterized protein n=1 Tax=Paxillus rubicundulus Ve08.2h10 TaxID=930991 RepID=A0A0D0E2G9_9AGAM|nr:hypothetical protein PAXRUDRAFT_655398 [Paxillus rubicundulus Ve08.2h10]